MVMYAYFNVAASQPARHNILQVQYSKCERDKKKVCVNSGAGKKNEKLAFNMCVWREKGKKCVKNFVDKKLACQEALTTNPNLRNQMGTSVLKGAVIESRL